MNNLTKPEEMLWNYLMEFTINDINSSFTSFYNDDKSIEMVKILKESDLIREYYIGDGMITVYLTKYGKELATMVKGFKDL